MNVLIIGVTGLLGSEACKVFLENGDTVRGLSLPALPKGYKKDPRVELIFENYLTISDEKLDQVFHDVDYFVFAAGVDERVKVAPPAYDFFEKFNVTPLERLLKFAKKNQVKHAVILGSYFTYFVKTRPELNLTENHPYIKSRQNQLEMALSHQTDTFHVSVLELPYIFGTQPGRKPVWVFLLEMIKKMKPATFFSKGGTALITSKQVGHAIFNATRQEQSNVYPLATANLTWRELFKIFHKYMGTPNKKIITLPNFIFKLVLKAMARKEKRAGFEGGLNLRKFGPMQCSKQFISPDLGAKLLNIPEDDINLAIKASVEQSLAALRTKEYGVDMEVSLKE